MIYDFSTPINRANTSAIKLDFREKIFGKADVLPMWVADMDFATPPFIIDRLKQRLAHPILGYTFRDIDFDKAIVGWMQNRFGWNIESQWISFAPGIIAGFNHAIQAFTKPGDKILIQTPVYHPFYYAVRQNGRELLTNSLVLKDGKYSINFDDFEAKLKAGVKLFILCSPHNPVSRVWTKQELLKMAELCLKHKTIMVSDEIHADVVFAPHNHIPLASLSPDIAKETITFNSASKTFNIAGLTTAYAIISNSSYLKRYNLQLDRNGTNHGNIFGYESLKIAYSPQGEEWLNQMLAYVGQSISLVRNFLNENLPKIKLIEPEGTYLLWLDFRDFNLPTEVLSKKLIHEASIGFNAGDVFGKEGEGFQRMNIGCPQSTVQESLVRLKDTFQNI